MTHMVTQTGKKNVLKARFPHRDVLGIEMLSPADITDVLDLAEYYVVQNKRKSQTQALLKGLILMTIFLENSTRTRLSFDIAGKRLGAGVVNMAVETSSLKKGESFEDTLTAVGAMRPDIVVLRSPHIGAAQKAAGVLGCPVINAGDGTGEHPTQALLDALTLRRHFGKLEGLKVAICGDVMHSRVAHSNAFLLQKMGARVSFTGPAALLPPSAVATPDMREGLKDADAVMVLRIQKERIEGALPMSTAAYFETYGLTPEKLAWAKKDAVVLHPGPMNRGVEIDPVLADNPVRSLIATQVEMGVAVRMALLDMLTRAIR